MAQSALIGAFLAGLLGGVHCLAMCGGFVAAFSRISGGGQPLVPARTLRARQLVAHAGRLLGYASLGLLVGAAGGAAMYASWGTAQRVLYVVANVMLLVLALGVARGGAAFPALERAGLAMFSRVMPAIPRLAQTPGWPSRLGLGFLWGLTPCGLVYGVLPVALMSGSAADGALVMLAFGAGTLPNLLAAGWLIGKARPVLDVRAVRIGAAVLIAGFALVGVWRAIAMPGALAHGPFCITS
jgi:hypothetical protein